MHARTLLTVYLITVFTNQTLISSIIQSRNKDHAAKWLLHGCLGGTKRALVNPCNDAHMSIKIFREGFKEFGKVNSNKRFLLLETISSFHKILKTFSVFADHAIVQISF